MIEDRPRDVLVVGTDRAVDAHVLRDGGFSVEEARTSIDAMVVLANRRVRVVVFSARDVEGRVDQAVQAFQKSGHEPEILLTVPPSLDDDTPETYGLSEDAILSEPYFPEQLLHRIRLLLERRKERSLGYLTGGISPLLGSSALAGLIADIAELNRSVSSLDGLVDVLLEIFQRRTMAQRASLLLYDRRKKELVVKKAVGLPEGVTVETRIPLGEGIAGRAAREGKPILVKDVRNDRFEELANQGDYRTTSCLSLPLMVDDTLLGVLNVADKANGQAFDEDDLYLLGRLAQQAAVTLDNSLRLRRMRALSIIDDLTTLYNRRFFRRYLDREFRRALRYKRPLTLAILDLDHFKLFNDLNGHEAGNRALRKIGEILKTSFRTTDIACRYGGEEFAVILPETEKGAGFVPDGQESGLGAYRFLERVRARIEEERFENEENLPGGSLTISGGVASYPADAETVEDLLESADRSLYLAKAEGRNRVHLA